MLAVTVICVGRLKESYWVDSCAEYAKRLSRFCSLNIKELAEAPLAENPSAAQIEAALSKEADAILAVASKESFTCALCVEGAELSSTGFAEKIEQLALGGKSRLCFIIGSSFGLSERVKSACDMRLSFSKMTFPHKLFRTLLLEQLYRAFSINGSMKYHK